MRAELTFACSFWAGARQSDLDGSDKNVSVKKNAVQIARSELKNNTEQTEML